MKLTLCYIIMLFVRIHPFDKCTKRVSDQISKLPTALVLSSLVPDVVILLSWASSLLVAMRGPKMKRLKYSIPSRQAWPSRVYCMLQPERSSYQRQ